MKVKEFDLYQNGTVLELSDSSKYLEREAIEYTATKKDKYYKFKDGDTLLTIANDKFKGKLKHPNLFWWIIADANKIENPLDLDHLIGEEIVIPDPILFLINVSNG